jgi:hypothetical protein
MSTSSASSGTPGVFSSEESATAPPDKLAATPGGKRAKNGSASERGSRNARRDEAGTELDQVRSAQPDDGLPAPEESPANVAATSSVSAEAQQGEGPAAAGASASGVSRSIAHTSAVSVVIGPDGAAAACDAGVVVSGPHGAAAASEAGVAAVGADGAASSSNAANATSAAVNGTGRGAPTELTERLARLEEEARELGQRLR